MKYVVPFLLLVMPTSGHSAWFVTYPDVTAEQKEITDETFEFQLGGMRCGVSKTDFTRAPDDSIMESRRLYCWTATDTMVFTSAGCSLEPLYHMTSLGIQIGEQHYSPAVVCGPSRLSRP